MTNIPVTPQLAFIESPMQLLLIFGVIFVLFGTKKMPTMARDLGKGIRLFKKSLSGEDDLEDIIENDQLISCAQCGTTFRPGTRFCSNCGQSLEKKIENSAETLVVNNDNRNTAKKVVKQTTRKKKS